MIAVLGRNCIKTKYRRTKMRKWTTKLSFAIFGNILWNDSCSTNDLEDVHVCFRQNSGRRDKGVKIDRTCSWSENYEQEVVSLLFAMKYNGYKIQKKRSVQYEQVIGCCSGTCEFRKHVCSFIYHLQYYIIPLPNDFVTLLQLQSP